MYIYINYLSDTLKDYLIIIKKINFKVNISEIHFSFLSDLQLEFLLLKLTYLNNIIKCMIFKLVFVEKFIQLKVFVRNENILIKYQ